MRADRRHDASDDLEGRDARPPGARDRDRILYSEPFRRLLGVTQVVGAHEGTVFHNRLTHSIKVSQIARRLAERMIHDHTEAGTMALLDAHGGVEPEVAEAAALAHDIGHPPFGHAGEVVLDELTRARGCTEGFEGNAQSFRILTKLAFRKVDPDDPPGLDLSRATLRASLKYPWLRALDEAQQPIAGEKRSRKWGAYDSEVPDLDFALAMEPAGAVRSLEAEIMDWADDVTYAVHDLEDFYRAGLIPLPTLAQDLDERERFLTLACERSQLEWAEAEEAFERMRLLLPTTPFTGAAEQLGAMSVLRSQLINTLLAAFAVPEPGSDQFVRRDEMIVAEVLKQLTWTYVITSPHLSAQEYGQRRVITEIFDAFCEIDVDGKAKPAREVLRSPFLDRALFADCPPARRAADFVASLTEPQAFQLHGRLTGHTPGSVMDPVI
ncbi:MAG: dGTP triphosphohydrolase [Actinomycetota bacterium]